ncbi:ester cyclase [Pandoraea sp. ISTKB]|uniref:ester cyclase n=1 Tax=Pandoraea sp. ISTKB TaxID=1586708 RepID=UPI0008473C69|nr:ester cyclase [Pandoraea sp. ISTKB]ODP35722.1 polyketide cyclase [Pandoraea sp. ISTKB]
MNTIRQRPLRSGLRILAGLIFAASAVPVFAADTQLVEPKLIVADKSLPKAQLDAQILAARRFDTFWNTGDESYAHAALSPTFFDNTLPPGRPQGVEGVLKASKAFREAVPDLRAEVVQMIVAGDRVSAFLRFTGHFTGKLGDKQGQGQPIDFIAMDIYRIEDGRVAEDWHLEDNLTFLQKAGIVAK